MYSKLLITILLVVTLPTYGCHHTRHAVNNDLTVETGDLINGDEEIYLLYPQLLLLQEKLDTASAYYYLGDLDSSLLLSEDLIKVLQETRATSPEEPICEQIDILEDKTRCLRQRVIEEMQEKDWKLHIASALDSIAQNHVVEDEIDVVYNWRTKHWLKYFQGKGRRHFIRWLERVEKYRDIIEPILIEVGVPRDLLYVAVIESGLNLNARSKVRAIGPWQFMAGTGRLFGLRINWWLDERKDIIASTYAAAHYLKHLHKLFGSWPLALASYNAGEYRVAHAVSRQKTDDYWRLRLPSQTRWFVPKFMAALAIARDPHKYGFGKPAADPLLFDIIEIKRSTDLRLVAKAAGCTVTRLKKLNPALKRWATPPEMVIELKVPRGTGEKCLAGIADIPPEKRVSWHRHKVKRGEALSLIADKYDISISELKRLNNIRNAHRIREGKILLIPVKDIDMAKKDASSPGYRTPPKLPDKVTLKRYKAPAGYKKIVYTVKDRDTLSEIAERYNTRLSRLRSWNDLRYKSLIHPGDRLVIYVPPGFRTAEETPRESGNNGKKRIVHVVKRGETLSHISRRYRAKISDILAWNNSIKPDRLYPGDRITIWLDAD